MATTSNIVNTLGAGSGIDIKALAENLVEAERAPRKDRLDTKIKQTEAKISGYSVIKYSLSQLKSAFEKINDASDFASVKASNSQPSAFGVTTGSTSGTGSYSIEVTRIATEQRTASETFTGRDVSLNGGQPFTLQLTSGSGSTDISVAPKDSSGNPRAATPADVVSAINGAKTGVTAQLLNTGSGYQIVLSGQTGAANQFSLGTTSTVASTAQINTQTDTSLVVSAAIGTSAVSATWTDANGQPASLDLVQSQDGLWRPADGASLPPASATLTLDAKRPAVLFNQPLQAAQDASLKVNGLTVTRAGNSISDVIDGVTLNLNTATTGAARLDLNRETGTIKDNLKALVTAYNEFADNLKILGDSKSKVDQYGGALAGDSLLQSVQSRVRQMITKTSSTPGTSIQAARNTGLSFDRNGVLQLDEAKLDSALQDHFDEVVQMFSAGTNNKSVYSSADAGLAGDAVKKIDEMLRTTGVIDQQTASAQKQVTGYQSDLTKLQDQMDKLLERYTSQFSVMESIVGSTNSLKTSLKSSFDGMMASYSK